MTSDSTLGYLDWKAEQARQLGRADRFTAKHGQCRQPRPALSRQEWRADRSRYRAAAAGQRVVRWWCLDAPWRWRALRKMRRHTKIRRLAEWLDARAGQPAAAAHTDPTFGCRLFAGDLAQAWPVGGDTFGFSVAGHTWPGFDELEVDANRRQIRCRVRIMANGETAFYALRIPGVPWREWREAERIWLLTPVEERDESITLEAREIVAERVAVALASPAWRGLGALLESEVSP